MALTQPQDEPIAHVFPRPRGNVALSQLTMLHAILSVAEPRDQWRGVPAHVGHGHPIDTRMSRWAKSGGRARGCAELPRQAFIRVKVEIVSLDSTVVKGHPEGTGALQTTVPKPSGSPAEAGAPSFIGLLRMLGAQ